MDDSEVSVPSTSSPIATPSTPVHTEKPAVFEEKPGGIRKRFSASVFDNLILSIPLNLFYSLILLFSEQNLFTQNTLLNLSYYGLLLLSTFVYFVYFNVNKGTTPGKKIYGMKIVDINTKNNLSYKNAFIRALTNRIPISVPFIGYLYGFINFLVMVSSTQRRGIHDKLSRSQVLIVRKSWSIWKQFGFFIILVILSVAPFLLPISKLLQMQDNYTTCLSECLQSIDLEDLNNREQAQKACFQKCPRPGY